MNHCYRLIWNRALGHWQVAGEHTRRRRRAALSASALLCTALLANPAQGSQWVPGNIGDWADSGNWIGGVPIVGDYVFIEDGEATLTGNAGTIEALYLALNEGSRATLTLNGSAARLVVESLIALGSHGGEATLNIQDGAALEADSIGLSSTSTGSGLVFDGGILRFVNDDGGSLSGDGTILVEAGGAFVETEAGSSSLRANITGPGRFTKLGSGELRLRGNNNYSGGTTISEGTLAGNTDSLQGDFINNGTLEFSQSDDGTFIGDISGTGQFVMYGSGSITLRGNNSYTGGTLLTVGTLIGDTDSLQGNILNLDGTLVFDQDGDGTFSGVISGDGTIGDGTLAKQGAGTVTLTGVNTYTGATTVRAGTLREGNAAAFVDGAAYSVAGGTLDLNGHDLTMGALSGTGGTVDLGGAALTIDQAGATTYAGTLTGSGTLTKRGAGTLTLSGTATMGSPSAINGGTLSVNGQFNGALRVNDGGTLGGTGTVGDVTVASGGSLAPGNSIGTLTVSGDLTLDAGSVYEVEVDPAGTASDLTRVTGTASLAGSVVHVGEDGSYRPFATYTILTADGGLVGNFDEATSDYTFLDAELRYDGNDVLLALARNDVRFDSVARTPNQRSAAGGVGSLPPGDPLYNALALLSGAQASAAFDSLSGEAHASLQAGLQRYAGLVQGRPLARLRANLTAGWLPGQPIAANGDIPAAALPQPADQPLWVELIGQEQRLDGDGNAAAMEHATYGLFLGGDTAAGATPWRVGAALGYGEGDMRVDDRASTADTESVTASLYGGRTAPSAAGRWHLLLGGAYSHHSIDSERRVRFNGFDETLIADYRARTTQVFGEVGHAWTLNDALTLTPFAGLAWSEQRTDGFTEEGGAAALTADEAHTAVTTTTLGVRGRAGFDWAGRAVALHAELGWRHAEGELAPESRFAFDGGETFTVAGAPIARDSALIGLGAGLALTEQAGLHVRYDGQFGAGNREHAAQVRISWRF